MKLKTGATVPDFTLPDTNGEDVPLKEGAAAKVVVFT